MELIPDQTLQIGQPYEYSLNHVFSGNHFLFGAIQPGQSRLPEMYPQNLVLVNQLTSRLTPNSLLLMISIGTNFNILSIDIKFNLIFRVKSETLMKLIKYFSMDIEGGI
ncbi:MAG: hypothetical protein JSR33_05825 [Proteobacteria bacterium]|nr:hypothetical protein [Pseudomonadota bacterium]